MFKKKESSNLSAGMLVNPSKLWSMTKLCGMIKVRSIPRVMSIA